MTPAFARVAAQLELEGKIVQEAAGKTVASTAAWWESGVSDLRDKIEAQREHRGYAY
jgi:hypothetical protein